MTTLLGSSTTPMLPLETIEEIIDLLVPHRSSLLQCSLVSSTWRSHALHYLLCYVSIDRQSKIDAFAALLAANSTLGTHLREVSFQHHTPSLSLLPKLSNVEILSIANLRFNGAATFDSFMGLAGATFPRVLCLILDNSDFCSPPNDVANCILKVFPHISELRLAYNKYSSSIIPPGDRSFAVGNLRTLKLIVEDSAVLDHFADRRWHASVLLEDFEYYQQRVHAWRGDVNDIDEHYAAHANGLSNFLYAATSLRRIRIIAESPEEMDTLLKRVTRSVEFMAHAALRTFQLECRTTPITLLALVGLIRAIRRPISMDAIILSVNGTEYTFWLQVVDAIGPLPLPDKTPVELVLKFHGDAYMITSLATLEGALRELLRT